MDEPERDTIKRAFNDPADPVRVLVATDAASEGLNLQATARYLLHYDIPWNPSRLEQRNGRLDRHGQARDVDGLPLRQRGRPRPALPRLRRRQGRRDPRGPRLVMGEVFDAAFRAPLRRSRRRRTWSPRDLDAAIEQRAAARPCAAGRPPVATASQSESGLTPLARARVDLSPQT